jgi:hypothetical protein
MTMRTFPLTLLASTMLLLAACGGGGGDSSTSSSGGSTNTPGGGTAPSKPTQPDPSNVKGLVFDGPVSGAKVICDVNRNAQLDVGEVTALTSGTGQFNMACPVGTQLVVLGDGVAMDVVSKQPMRGTLIGLVTETTQGFTQINALTTLAATLQNSGFTVTSAENLLRSVFAIPSDISIYGHHPATNAALLNTILSVQTTLLSVAGEIAFINRAVGASDNPSINTVHLGVSSQFGSMIATAEPGSGSTWSSLQPKLKQAIEGAVHDLASTDKVSQSLRTLLTNPATAAKIVLNAYLAGKIASDTYEAQGRITDVQLQGLDLTKPLPSSINAFIKASATWTTRFDPLQGQHFNTAKLPVESTYLDSIGGFLKLDDGTYIDPRLKEDGTYALPVEITSYDPDTNSLTIMLNRKGDHLNMGLVEPIQFDPFSNPTTGFTIFQFKPYSSPDELLGSGHVYGNIQPNSNQYQAIVPIGKDNIKVITLDADPRIAVGIRLYLSKYKLRPGDRVIALWSDSAPQDNHSVVLINSGQRGRGVSQMLTQTFEVSTTDAVLQPSNQAK